MIPQILPQVLEHLWQSTLFAALAFLLTLALRKNAARVRHWVWFAASVKFLIPFSLLVALGSQITWRPAPVQPQRDWIAIVDQIGGPLMAPATVAQVVTRPEGSGTNYLPFVVFGLWACGFVALASHWLSRWWRVRVFLRSATPWRVLNAGSTNVPAKVSSALHEPAVFGILRPALLLPAGIIERIERAQLEAILSHELAHVRRRDNLTAAIHMVAEALFWFHPLVWWVGSRLIEERERACDEAVLEAGGDPNIYAEGILNVCKLYIESPLACVSGVSGSNLRKRIEEIMSNRITSTLNTAKRTALALASAMAIAIPLLIGVVHSPAQEKSASTGQGLRFEVASIKPSGRQGGGGGPGFRSTEGGPGSCGFTDDNFDAAMQTPTRRLCVESQTLLRLIIDAYGVEGCGLRSDRCDRVLGGPNWMTSDEFDIVATAPANSPTFTMEQVASKRHPIHVRQMLQTLLEDRFRLKVHSETRELPVYALTVSKNGPKLVAHGDSSESPSAPSLAASPGGRPAALRGTNVSMARLANFLSSVSNGRIGLGRPVVDRTGLGGTFDFNVQFAFENSPAAVSAPSIFQALEKELGLRLESTKAPVEVLVVDRAEMPSEN